jgi:hypothetical protein
MHTAWFPLYAEFRSLKSQMQRPNTIHAILLGRVLLCVSVRAEAVCDLRCLNTRGRLRFQLSRTILNFCTLQGVQGAYDITPTMQVETGVTVTVTVLLWNCGPVVHP